MAIETVERTQIAPPPTKGSPSERPHFALKRIIAAVAVLFVLVIAVAALLPSSFWRWLIIHEVATKTGRSVNIDGAVTVHLFTLNPQLIVEGFTLSNAPWASDKPMMTVRKFDATLSLKSVLKLHLIFPRVSIDTPSIAVERDASGRANWDFSNPAGKPSGGASAPLHLPVIQELSLTNGSLTAVDRIRKLTFNGQVSVQENQNAADNHALKLRGSGTLNGKPFQLVLDGEPLIGVLPSKPYSFETSITAADIKLRAEVKIPHPFDLAALEATFRLSGNDLADVYYLTGLALPNTPPYEASGTLVRDKLRFKVDDFRGRLGSSDIAGNIAIDTAPKRPKLTATLVSKLLNMADLAAPLGTQATPARKPNSIAPAGATAPAAARAPAAAPATATAAPPALLLPDADLQVQRVRAMDADVNFDAAAVTAAKMPIRKVHFHLNLDDGKIALDPLAFTLPQGEFSGTIAIDAQGAVPQTSIDMKLSNVDLAEFKSKSGKDAPLEGHLLGRIKLHGSGTSVHKTAADADGDVTFVVPHGEMKEALAELTGIDLSRGLGLILTKNESKTDIRCGVANFEASDGELKASTFVIDTTNVLVTGQGDINLRDETLDLSLQGRPKKARMLRLRTPITLRGTLLQPKIGVEPGKLAAQTGGALALGALLTPVAAVLAFVDGGLAKDANCSALIGEAKQDNSLPK